MVSPWWLSRRARLSQPRRVEMDDIRGGSQAGCDRTFFDLMSLSFGKFPTENLIACGGGFSGIWKPEESTTIMLCSCIAKAGDRSQCCVSDY